MRTAKTVSISMSPEQLAATEQLAKVEHRTMSELIREALRRYQQEKRWEKVVRYQAKSKAQGIQEIDVVPMIKRWRKERRPAPPAA
jgi:Arc/MetJ-type ribon-helix-helix transcriptional regulator